MDITDVTDVTSFPIGTETAGWISVTAWPTSEGYHLTYTGSSCTLVLKVDGVWDDHEPWRLRDRAYRRDITWSDLDAALATATATLNR